MLRRCWVGRESAHADNRERSPQGSLSPDQEGQLIRKVHDDHEAIEIVSKHGNAVLVSAEVYAALREGSYLLRSPATARRLLKAYENTLAHAHVSERELPDPDAWDAAEGAE